MSCDLNSNKCEKKTNSIKKKDYFQVFARLPFLLFLFCTRTCSIKCILGILPKKKRYVRNNNIKQGKNS